MKKNIFYAIITFLCMTACVEDKFTENEFIDSTNGGDTSDIALIERGNRVLTYDPNTWQLGFNDAKIEFRVHDDNMGYFYILKCNTMPTQEGQTVKGNLTWTTYNDNVTKDLDFKVSKIDADGKIWLFNAKSQIGVVVVSVK